MTTVRELSQRLGVSKTVILKYCKEELHLKTEPRKTLQLSANDCSAIAERFSSDEQVKQDVSKNESANNIENNLQFNSDEVISLQIENAALKAENDGLKREIELLKERIAVADLALEREQMQVRGFWSRLGQKLLGNGKG